MGDANQQVTLDGAGRRKHFVNISFTIRYRDDLGGRVHHVMGHLEVLKPAMALFLGNGACATCVPFF
jgi:hypothetical protein